MANQQKLLSSLLVLLVGVAIASEKAAPSTDEVRDLLAALRYDEIMANFIEGSREHFRRANPEITDEMWEEVWNACDMSDAQNIQISVISAFFDRDEIRELTLAMRSPGGKQFAETLVRLATKGPEVYDPDFSFSLDPDTELKEFLELPIVAKWVAHMPEMEAKTREAGRSWFTECLKAASIRLKGTAEEPSN